MSPTRITAVELRRIEMPLVAPFRTAMGAIHHRDVLLVRVVAGDAEGWGECVADPHPFYSSEHVEEAARALRRFLVPAITAMPGADAMLTGRVLARFRGCHFAKAALEGAVLDAELRARGTSLAEYLGATRTRVPSGVSVGIPDSVGELLDLVAAYREAGYVRIKLKIRPGWDVEPVAAVRGGFGDDLSLQVDGNGAYSLSESQHLARLDDYGLTMLEQPFAADELRAHAVLARRMRTPICLDESILSATHAAQAILLRACSVVNIKPGRVGGLLEAKRIHDVCLAHGVPVWCGGMLESGIGRAGLLALAALPGFTLPGDMSASNRYFHEDVTAPFVLDDGHLAVPHAPGIGVEPIPERLSALTVASERLL